MNWKYISGAILLETMFAQWCSENYELFHDPRGSFPGIGSPREIFINDRGNIEAITFALFNY